MFAAIRGLWRDLLGAGGSPGAVLLAVVISISGLIFWVMYKRYVGVLAASDTRKKSERDGYERLRASLSGGNIAARLYADWLTKFLDAVDRFFGDAGKADQTPASVRSADAGTAVDRPRLRPLSVAGPDLSGCNHLHHLGCVRSRRTGRGCVGVEV